MSQQQLVHETPNSEDYRRRSNLLRQHIRISKYGMSYSKLLRLSVGKYGKIFGDLADDNSGRCAVGAIVSELGWDGSNFDKPWSDIMGCIQLHAIHLGVNKVNDNDNGLSWEEIADKLRKSRLVI